MQVEFSIMSRVFSAWAGSVQAGREFSGWGAPVAMARVGCPIELASKANIWGAKE
jgi:hypothetical protein